MDKASILQCINVMHDVFRKIARTDDDQQAIRPFYLAYDKAYFDLIKDVTEEDKPI